MAQQSRQQGPAREVESANARRERESFLQSTADDTFPLEEAPNGVLDERQDGARYPHRARAAITSTDSRVGRTCDAPVQAPESAADQALAKLLRQRNQLCGSVARAAMSAELAAMAMAVRKRDADGVAESAAAVIVCLGAQVAGSFSAGARDKLLVLMRDTAAHVSATRSYNLLHSDSEAMEAREMTRDSAREAVATLRDFTTDNSGVNPRFKEAVDNQMPFNPRYARYLGPLAWQSQLDSGGNAVPVNGSDSSCTGDLGAEPELDEEAASSLHSAYEPDLPVPVPNSDGAIADPALSMAVMSDKTANTTPSSAHVNSSPRPQLPRSGPSSKKRTCDYVSSTAHATGILRVEGNIVASVKKKPRACVHPHTITSDEVRQLG
ncbi:hypothetical protein PHYSODRAFT_341459 [Phytophthora sojae]|uniref:Uncharacterized protein n=1 Tax=Phytophthora sojae (strain P6497) TaxID=1094619 RepID=G5ADB2_PHYSP|nr:hypothetical protein PHYSODRAFT_341459 [Phytophthora sojae]EGZ06165.1 hypothetical protein PHYSODRAFT_341459 [Phytophthora sojae]|eukprot:XP_009538062.1 hypothetical protein PHYSODRAFT_341459 [Phytophthora sojae]